ncbi:UNVERIFIED_CONTAM: hypothetical protein Slati_2230700 [Sesamum latifolium]|uniref:Uncharacterized protein n=1 Tax=Sesamum latifolium TaxID=2727402 RepID=A0AAW2WYD6_9LAMI
MSSSDESVRFVGESNPGDDPSEATSRMAGSQSAGPSSGRRQSLRRLAANFCRLIDEEEEEAEGSEGEASSPGEEEKRLQIWYLSTLLLRWTWALLVFNLLTSNR